MCRCDWDTIGAKFISEETAIWSTDAFYPLMMRPDLMKHLAQKHMIYIGKNETIQEICIERDISSNSKGWLQLVAWDMECAALFSACKVLGLETAAGLVVSWSNEQWTEIGENGGTSRDKDNSSDMAHEIEDKLIVRAVDFLFI